MGEEVLLPLEDLVDGDLVKKTVDTRVDQGNHLVDGHGGVLLLLEELGKTFTTTEGLLGGSIEIRTELGEGSDFTVLGQEELQRTSDLLHRLDLGSRADARNRETDVDGGADSLVEKFCFQEDLSIGNGDDIGRDVGGNVSTLRLDDG